MLFAVTSAVEASKFGEAVADGGEVVQAFDAIGLGFAAPERGQQQRRARR